MENTDAVGRKVYRAEAKAIEQLRQQIIEVSSKETAYDIFICYKEADEDGNRTIDSVLAQDIYDALTEKGYRVFFSRISLEDKLGREYEPYIFAALNSARVMLVVGTDYEYFHAVWVKNEWNRFLKLIAAGKKKTLIPCFKGIDAYNMPKEFAKLQAQDLGKVGAVQDLLRGIDKLFDNSPSTQTDRLESQIRAQALSQADNTVQLGIMALNGADPNTGRDYTYKYKYESKKDVSYTCLSETIRSAKDRDMVQLLLNYGADPNYLYNDYTRYGSSDYTIKNISSLADVILYNPDVEMMRILLAAGADPNAVYISHYADPVSDVPVLYLAFMKANEELIRLLLDAGASLDSPVTSHTKKFPLKYAGLPADDNVIKTARKFGWKGPSLFKGGEVTVYTKEIS
ncbi:MAG: TIR domain-containing protein [Clostridiales bacterium]|nr:TIR domain-containing protein [Clostridiales bacterium]